MGPGARGRPADGARGWPVDGEKCKNVKKFVIALVALWSWLAVTASEAVSVLMRSAFALMAQTAALGYSQLS
jgi:hypothetical protein